MSIRIDTYSILVENFGEGVAYEICEKIGGMDITIPTKAHKTYRLRTLAQRHKKLLQNSNTRTRFVDMFSKKMNLSRSVIYKIIKENE